MDLIITILPVVTIIKIFPSLAGSQLTVFYPDESPAILKLANQWLNFAYSRSHACRYGRTNKN